MNRSWRVTGEMPTSARRERNREKREDGVGEGEIGGRMARTPGGGGGGQARSRGAPARGCGVSPLAASAWRRDTRRSCASPPRTDGRPPPRPLPHSAACSRRTARRPPRGQPGKPSGNQGPLHRVIRGAFCRHRPLSGGPAIRLGVRDGGVRPTPGSLASSEEFPISLAIGAAARGTSTRRSPRPCRSTNDPRGTSSRVARARGPACVCATSSPPRADGDQRVLAVARLSTDRRLVAAACVFSGTTNSQRTRLRMSSEVWVVTDRAPRVLVRVGQKYSCHTKKLHSHPERLEEPFASRRLSRDSPSPPTQFPRERRRHRRDRRLCGVDVEERQPRSPGQKIARRLAVFPSRPAAPPPPKRAGTGRESFRQSRVALRQRHHRRRAIAVRSREV